ncbi:hypothetical protein CLI64_24710 [Nostoc sp. CENA543]|nr:hypothetical protein CLI64_24710 [Nostoc sp. CENA543]
MICRFLYLLCLLMEISFYAIMVGVGVTLIIKKVCAATANRSIFNWDDTLEVTPSFMYQCSEDW